MIGIFRDTTIGTDIGISAGYYGVWQDPFNSIDSVDVESGFLWLTYILKSFFDSYYFYYGVIFFLNMYLYLQAVKKMQINPAVFFAILFMSSYIINSYNVIRQYLALSAGILIYAYFLYGVELRSDKSKRKENIIKVLLFELLILLLTKWFHTSVILLTVLPFFHIKEVSHFLSKDIVLWTLLIVSIVINISFSDNIQRFVIYAQAFLQIGGRADYWASYIEEYSEVLESTHGVLSTVITGVIAILASRERRNVLFCIGFVGFLLLSLASKNLGYIGRLFANMAIFLIFYYAQILGGLLKSYKVFNMDFRWLIIILLIFDWSTGFYYTTVLNTSISPYKTYLLK